MMTTIHLYGHLRKQFGPKHRFAVKTAGEALRALNCAFPGKFVEALKTGSYKLIRGDRYNGMPLADLDLVNSFNLGMADLHLIPAPKGASNGKGIAKTILGVALIGGAIFMSGGTLAAPLSVGSLTVPGMSWGTVAALGLGVALSGASTLLSKPSEGAKKTDSYNISGPTNTGSQGDPIALIYGHCIVGSVNVSFDSNIEDIGAYEGVRSIAERFVGGNYGIGGGE